MQYTYYGNFTKLNTRTGVVNMNILYIDHYAGSDIHGMEFRPFYMAREWSKRI